MITKNYYALLNIETDATEDDIKKAYRKLAFEFHPDVNTNKDAEETFKAIGEAYAVLSDQMKRKIYDQTGETNFQRFGRVQPPSFHRGSCRGRGRGRGMGKCSGLDALFRKRPRAYRQKPTAPNTITE